MRELRSAVVVGLGLIGGSLARELAARGVRVSGWDRDADTLRAALREGGIHAALGSGLEGIGEADLVAVAVPVAAAVATLRTAAPHLHSARLVTDVGSTKRSIGAAAEALGIGGRWVGSHPLAGDHRSGWAASRRGLFRGARVFLCPGPSTGPDALALARGLWSAVGAEPETADAATHDQRLAWSSHLPQAASTALALALGGEGIPHAELGPGGRDMTRLAGSSAEVWTGIALDNAANLAAALAGAEAELRELRAALEADDQARVRRFFAGGVEWRRSAPPE